MDPPGFGATPVSVGGQGLSKGAGTEPQPCRSSRAWAGRGQDGGSTGTAPASLRPSKPRRLPRAACWPYMSHKPASMISLVQCPPAASPETQKLTKDAGFIKRRILSSALVSHQFPPHYGSPNKCPAQSQSLAQGSGHVCTRHTGPSPLQNCSTLLGSNPFSTGTQGTHRSVQAVGCQHPARHPGSELVLTQWEAPSPDRH